MSLEVTADTAIAARDKASTLASSVLGKLSAVCGHVHCTGPPTILFITAYRHSF